MVNCAFSFTFCYLFVCFGGFWAARGPSLSQQAQLPGAFFRIQKTKDEIQMSSPVCRDSGLLLKLPKLTVKLKREFCQQLAKMYKLYMKNCCCLTNFSPHQGSLDSFKAAGPRESSFAAPAKRVRPGTVWSEGTTYCHIIPLPSFFCSLLYHKRCVVRTHLEAKNYF